MNPVEMKQILSLLYAGETLSEDMAYQCLLSIGHGDFSEIQIAAFLSALNMRSVTIDELKGLRKAMLELCLQVKFEGYELMDVCGTGGDGKDTFNISTLAAFVVAGAGIPIAKHGNYSVSSHCGSSNVLEYLGLRFSADPDMLNAQLENAGICILHAPLFHPAMKFVAPVRKAMQVKTVFNILGPLSNPAQPTTQVSGVYNMETARLYHYLMQGSLSKFAIVYALDGYDEISLTGSVKVLNQTGEKILSPKDFGFPIVEPLSLSGGHTIPHSAEIFMKVLEGTSTTIQRDVVIANAALAISTYRGCSMEEGKFQAIESLESHEALNVFQRLIKISQA